MYTHVHGYGSVLTPYYNDSHHSKKNTTDSRYLSWGMADTYVISVVSLFLCEHCIQRRKGNG